MATDYDAIITKLEESLALGEATIEYDDFKATYRSPAQIQSAIAYFRQKKNEAAGKKNVMRVSYGSFSRE